MDSIEKKYYTSGEVATKCGVTVTSIHSWEKELGIRSKRNKNHRRYTRNQVAKLLWRSRIHEKYLKQNYQTLRSRVIQLEIERGQKLRRVLEEVNRYFGREDVWYYKLQYCNDEDNSVVTYQNTGYVDKRSAQEAMDKKMKEIEG